MANHADAIKNQALTNILAAHDLSALNQQRLQYLGRKGEITLLLKKVGSLPHEERKQAAQTANELKNNVIKALANRQVEIETTDQSAQLEKEKIDVSMSGYPFDSGGFHPITRMLERIHLLFSQAGFQVQTGPEIEDDYYNFTALNIPEHHPARAMHDTFYFDEKMLLRTHTSPVQIRTMERSKPPVRVIAPGRVYRCDSDITHTPMFHQVEGLVIDKSANFAELKSLLMDFLRALFEDENLQIRFRPSYFPFTEPSAEVDIRNDKLGNDKWLEVLGCGMVHPNVIRSMHLDPDEWQGYAFGLGVERLAMLRYGVKDLRQFFDNHLDFLRQF